MLRTDQIRKLKNMNKSSTFDSNFIGYFLAAVFGENLLMISSADGGNSNGVIYAALDAVKLRFIEGLLNKTKKIVKTKT